MPIDRARDLIWLQTAPDIPAAWDPGQMRTRLRLINASRLAANSTWQRIQWVDLRGPGMIRRHRDRGPALAADQPLGVVCLVLPDDTALAVPQPPSRCPAIRASQLPAAERPVYVVADGVLQFRLDGEKDADAYLAVDPIGAAMVRRQRTRRIVVPVSTQSHGDRGARSPLISVRIHGQDGLVGEGLAHELKRTAHRR